MACVLVGSDIDPIAALMAISEARGLEVPETLEQREWLMEFASWLASTRGQPQRPGMGR